MSGVRDAGRREVAQTKGCEFNGEPVLRGIRVLLHIARFLQIREKTMRGRTWNAKAVAYFGHRKAVDVVGKQLDDRKRSVADGSHINREGINGPTILSHLESCFIWRALGFTADVVFYSSW
ncbi:hypothetical protein GCM10010985_31510 [Caballeronia grimmiae]|uniref:Uncharacterized protein n=1 Tax=Caballeronia grimmiae TaxID=1071679 RepID=A0ABQ1RMC0_9BURK|nr:hypothetical protein GCM10010985_31510 [Caballeronia grimmiae]